MGIEKTNFWCFFRCGAYAQPKPTRIWSSTADQRRGANQRRPDSRWIWRRVGGTSKKAPKVSFLDLHPVNFCFKSLIQSYYAIFFCQTRVWCAARFCIQPLYSPLLKIHLWRQLPGHRLSAQQPQLPMLASGAHCCCAPLVANSRGSLLRKLQLSARLVSEDAC